MTLYISRCVGGNVANANLNDGSCLDNDCAGDCGGVAVEDECGECGGDGKADEFCYCDGNVLDCDGECGGSNFDTCPIGTWLLMGAEYYEESCITGDFIQDLTFPYYDETLDAEIIYQDIFYEDGSFLEQVIDYYNGDVLVTYPGTWSLDVTNLCYYYDDDLDDGCFEMSITGDIMSLVFYVNTFGDEICIISNFERQSDPTILSDNNENIQNFRWP